MPNKLLLALVCSLTICIGSAWSQGVTTVGTDASLDVATWNIEWFGNANNGPSNEDTQFDNVLDVISNAGIDVWAVQEIAHVTRFNELVTALGPDFEGTLATNSGEQRIGYIYNTQTVQVESVKHILESFEFEFAFRPPLQLEASITLPDTTLDITFIVAHMKAFSDAASYERRVDASSRIKNHIDFTTLEDEPVIVLGDLNDELLNSTFANQTSPYENFILDTENYTVLTLPLEESGAGSFCNNAFCTSTGSFLDHIIITNELNAAFVENSAGFIPDLQVAINLFGSSTSDHLPVVARFDFSQVSTSTETPDALPAAITVDAPFPNPFANATNIGVHLNNPAALQIDVYDLLGRRVHTLENSHRQPGSYQYTLPADNLTPGIYLLRVVADEMVKTVPVTLID